IANAVYQMGPDAIPYLRRGLRQQDSFYEKALNWSQAKLPPAITRLLPRPKGATYLRGLASTACYCLARFGPEAREALPALIECFKKDDLTAMSASRTVSVIGPSVENLPLLLSCLDQKTNYFGQNSALASIRKIGVSSPALLARLTNTALVALPSHIRTQYLET